jgi:hypothetical protein
MKERRGAYWVLVGKPEGKSPLGRPKSKWENNIKNDLQDRASWAWFASIWLKIGTGDGRLSMR